MFVIFNEDEYAQGATLQAALDNWKEYYDSYPDFKDLTIVKGVKQKLTFSLEPIVEKPVVTKKEK